MSKHNNNLMPSASKRCSCGRCISIGEEAGTGHSFGYTCPDCRHRQFSPMTSEQFYSSFNLSTLKQQNGNISTSTQR